MLRRVSRGFVLAVFAVQVGLAAFAEERHEAVHHEGEADGGPGCPDASEGGNPCGSACACTCCPGHYLAVPVEVASSLAASTLPAVGHVAAADLPPRAGVAARVFRPPRA